MDHGSPRNGRRLNLRFKMLDFGFKRHLQSEIYNLKSKIIIGEVRHG